MQKHYLQKAYCVIEWQEMSVAAVIVIAREQHGGMNDRVVGQLKRILC